MFFQKPFSLSPRVAVLTLMQGFRLHSGSTDAADVSFRTFIIRHLMLRSLFIYAEILLYKSSLQPFRLCFRCAGRAGLFSGPAREIFFLFFGQLIDLKIHSRKLVSSDLIVDAVRNVINLFCELFSMFRKPLKAEGLYGE